jgi:hypothetical protein
MFVHVKEWTQEGFYEGNYRVRQKDIPYLERALCELWWGYGGGGGIDR